MGQGDRSRGLSSSVGATLLLISHGTVIYFVKLAFLVAGPFVPDAQFKPSVGRNFMRVCFKLTAGRGASLELHLVNLVLLVDPLLNARTLCCVLRPLILHRLVAPRKLVNSAGLLCLVGCFHV